MTEKNKKKKKGITKTVQRVETKRRLVWLEESENVTFRLNPISPLASVTWPSPSLLWVHVQMRGVPILVQISVKC